MSNQALPLNVLEYERSAAQQLSPMSWAYYASGAWDETYLAEIIEPPLHGGGCAHGCSWMSVSAR